MKNLPPDYSTVLKVSLVMPVFNEEDSLQFFIDKVGEVFKGQNLIQLELLFVNDGSTDTTLERLLDFQATDHRITIIDLSRNFCKEAALSSATICPFEMMTIRSQIASTSCMMCVESITVFSFPIFLINSRISTN